MTFDEPEITVHTIPAHISATPEELDGFTIPDFWARAMRPMTPEELAKVEARRMAESEANDARYAAGLASLEAESNDDTAHAVDRLLRLARSHYPDRVGQCGGCIGDDYGAPWPCAEWLIAVGEDEDA